MKKDKKTQPVQPNLPEFHNQYLQAVYSKIPTIAMELLKLNTVGKTK